MTNVKVRENKLKRIEAKQNKEEKQDNDSNKKRNIEKEINNRIYKILYTRAGRIELSKRLTGYSRTWRFIFFIINIEAVIFVLLSLTGNFKNIALGPIDISFGLVSGIFTVYVILLQYYINVLNYNERALRVHYHQLELEDLIVKLELLLVKNDTKETNISKQEMIKNYEQIVAQYQLALKNNENHRTLDFKRAKYDMDLKNYEDGNIDRKPVGKRMKDFTLDQLLIYANMVLTVVMFIVLFYVVFF